jgi:hypothetical protein
MQANKTKKRTRRERMKKLLNISVIAALAVLPLAANAAAVAGDPGSTISDAPVASNAPKYGLAEAQSNDGNLATAGYVKGAYNAAIKAVNKLETTKQDALTPEQITAISNVSGLSTRLDTAEGDIDALETAVGDANSGLVKDVADNASDIDALETAVGDANSGLTKAVADNASDIDALETAVGDANSGLVKDVAENTAAIADLQENALTSASLTDYAKQIGVTHTISKSTVTVPVVATWGSNTATTVTGSITGATYSETAPVVPEP